MIYKAVHLVKHLQDMIDVYGEDVCVTIVDNDAIHCNIQSVEEVDDQGDKDSMCDALYGGKTFITIICGDYI